MPGNASFETLMIPTEGWTCSRLKKEFDRIGVKLDAKINTVPITNLVAQYFLANNNFRHCGVLMQDFIPLRQEIDKLAIVTPLDKEKRNIAISCLAGYPNTSQIHDGKPAQQGICK